MEEGALAAAITARRAELGSRVLILGHHYQQDAVVQHADLTGDSLKLSQMAAVEARRRGSESLIFCGVHFMAETADIVTDGAVNVILPDLGAGCSMADMAAWDDTVACWEAITAVHAGERVRVIPITYVNSSAAIKAFVGQHGGACCTSSNAHLVFDWALRGGERPLEPGERVKLLFLPDQHLGRNTAKSRGFVTEVDAAADPSLTAQCALWQPRKPAGGLTAKQLHDADVVLWAGHCSVHKLFRPEHVAWIRANEPGMKVIVHPECSQDVVDLADLKGSTEFIIKEIEAAPAGSRFAVGTEIHLVNRLAARAASRGVEVRILSDCQCLCTTMYRIDQAHLLWVLDELAHGRVVNRISVHPEARALARLAIDRMLALVPAATRATVAVD
jgi:quinolinate synthase